MTEETTREGGTEETSTDQVEALQSQLEQAELKAQENWDSFLRARAELENFRKRTERDYERRLRMGKEDLLLGLVGVMDDLERALTTDEASGLRVGVEMIYRQLEKILALEGVELVPCVGQPFDPAVHEAVAVWESDEHDCDTVTDELRRGYACRGDLLRAARVRVARPVERNGQ